MRAFRVACLLAGLMLLSSAALAETISGVYEIKQDGKLMGAEKFDIDFASDGSVMAKGSGTIRLEEGGESNANDLTELRVRSTGGMQDYQREVYINSLPRKLVMNFDGINFHCQLNTGKGPSDHKVKAPGDAVVVDVGVYNHLTVLVRHAIKRGLLGKPIPFVVPSQFNQGIAYVEDRGDDSVKMEKGFFRARRYFIDLGTYGVSVWSDGTGCLIKIFSPMTGFSAEIKNYEGKRAPEAQPVKASLRSVDHSELVFTSPGVKGQSETKLRGVVRRPKGVEGMLPAVIFLSDTGAHDAEGKESVTGVKALTGELCDILSEMGFVVLSWDDRGVGGSGGDLAQATLDVKMKDVSAALEALKGIGGVDASRLYVMGLGEGANVAIRLAAARQDVKGVVALSPSPVSFTRLAEEQIRRRAANEGPVSEKAIKDHPVMIAIKKSREEKKDFFVIAGKPVYLDLYRQWDRLDPIADLKTLRVPILHIKCGQDQQVFPDLAEAFIAAGKGMKGYAYRSFDKLDHFLVRGHGTIGSYSDPDRVIDQEAAAFIGRWLNEGK